MNTIKKTAAILMLALTTTIAQAGDHVEAGRKLLKEKSRSVISLAVTSKMSAEGKMAAMLGGQLDSERTIDAVASVVDENGLALTAIAAIEPANAMPSMKLSNEGSISFKDEIISVKYILEDGAEVPAAVVLKDEELGVAFVAPLSPLSEKQKQQLKPLDLTGRPKVQILDKLLSITRLSKELRRTAAVLTSEVSAMITKPRRIYYPGTEVGAPAFDINGNLVGFGMVKQDKKKVMSAMDMKPTEMRPIIRSIEDIAPLLPQAKAAMKK